MFKFYPSKIQKYVTKGKFAVGAIAIVDAAALLRILLISQGYLVTNSDESTMGLMALHIANRGEQPIFFYGQNYMGVIRSVPWCGALSSFGAINIYPEAGSHCTLCIFSDKHVLSDKPALLKGISTRLAHFARPGHRWDTEAGTLGDRGVS